MPELPKARYGCKMSECGGAELKLNIWNFRNSRMDLTGVEHGAAGALLLVHRRWSDTVHGS